MKREQALDREERVAWRDTSTQKMQAQAEVELAKIRVEAEEKEKKRADEIRMVEIQAEAEEKNRADEIRIQIAKIEADKELTLKEMELKAQTQASSSTAVDLPPRNTDAIDAENAKWEKNTWAIKLSVLATGRAMEVYTRMSDGDAYDYNKLKKALLTRYNFTKRDSGWSSQRLKKSQTSSSSILSGPRVIQLIF